MASACRLINLTDHGNLKPRSGKGGKSLLDHRASRVANQRNPCELAKDKNNFRLQRRMCGA
ncbi:hypothetical protein ILUMI_18625, partial [Ignelater luminosus]